MAWDTPDPHGTSSKGHDSLLPLTSLFPLYSSHHCSFSSNPFMFVSSFSFYSLSILLNRVGDTPDPHGTSSKGQTDLYRLTSLFLLFEPIHVRLFFPILRPCFSDRATPFGPPDPL